MIPMHIYPYNIHTYRTARCTASVRTTLSSQPADMAKPGSQQPRRTPAPGTAVAWSRVRGSPCRYPVSLLYWYKVQILTQKAHLHR